jgi:hypothetical protein
MDFDPDHWVRLASEDPEEFERSRIAAIEDLIASAPAPIQQRLRGLQFRVDMERRRAHSAMGGALRLQQMMWDRFADLRFALQDLVATQEGAKEGVPLHGEAQEAPSATVLAFPSLAR